MVYCGNTFRARVAAHKQAAAENLRFLVFPDCCVSGYWFIRNLSVEQLAALLSPFRVAPAPDGRAPWYGVGVDDDEIRTANAMILDPYGRILAETHRAADVMVVADLDASLLDNATGRRWIRARRLR